MGHMKKYLLLFLTMLKIGLFTFGGGYAMISLLEHEFVTRKKWMESDEFLDMVAIAESTPGPIAINSATYIGFKNGGVAGSAFATLGVCTPSFVVIYLISLFFDRFLSVAWVAAAFRGIQVAVVFLILLAGLRLFRKLPKKPLAMVLFSLSVLCLTLLSLLSVRFSTIFYILVGALVGLTVYAISTVRQRKKSEEEGGSAE